MALTPQFATDDARGTPSFRGGAQCANPSLMRMREHCGTLREQWYVACTSKELVTGHPLRRAATQTPSVTLAPGRPEGRPGAPARGRMVVTWHRRLLREAAVSGRGRELAGRNPKLFQRLPGELLLRFAERAFLAELFQLPPRLTRLEPSGPVAEHIATPDGASPQAGA